MCTGGKRTVELGVVRNSKGDPIHGGTTGSCIAIIKNDVCFVRVCCSCVSVCSVCV